MNTRAIGCAAAMLIAVAGLAQQKLKPWTEWNKKETERILNDSAWAQTQVETDTSEMVFTPTTPTGGGDSLNRRGEGATNQATSVDFRIRWLSARPIRQALARQAELESGKMPDQLRFFAEGASEKRAVIAVTVEGQDQRFVRKVMQAINSANTGVLKNSTYLERKDGKRIFLQEYIPPQQNRLAAALFVFSRTIDGVPWLTADSGSIRFHSDYENKVSLDASLNSSGQVGNSTRSSGVTSQPENSYKFKLDMKFEVAKMIYNGVLEY